MPINMIIYVVRITDTPTGIRVVEGQSMVHKSLARRQVLVLTLTDVSVR